MSWFKSIQLDFKPIHEDSSHFWSIQIDLCRLESDWDNSTWFESFESKTASNLCAHSLVSELGALQKATILWKWRNISTEHDTKTSVSCSSVLRTNEIVIFAHAHTNLPLYSTKRIPTHTNISVTFFPSSFSLSPSFSAIVINRECV